MTAKRFFDWCWAAVAAVNAVVCIYHFAKGPFTSDSPFWLFFGLVFVWSASGFVREAPTRPSAKPPTNSLKPSPKPRPRAAGSRGVSDGK